MKKKLIHHILLLIIIGSSFISCEKPPEEEDPRILQEDKDLVLKTGTDLASTCWNIYCYAKQIYLWNENLPSIEEFNPEGYANGDGSDHDKINKLIEKIRTFSEGADRWSHAVKETNLRMLMSTSNLGFTIRLFVRYNPFHIGYHIVDVVPNSPADDAGIKRGDLILQFKDNDTQSFRVISDEFLENYKTYGKVIFKIRRSTGDEKIVEIVSYAPTTPSAVIAKKIMVEKSLAYLNTNSFIDEDKDIISEFFREIEINNITKLVLDLRNNGGGSQNAAIHLANQIVSTEFNDKPMLTQRWNNTVKDGKADLVNSYKGCGLKQGEFQFKFVPVTNNRFVSIYILTSEVTASSSELLINVLKPYFKNKLIIIGKTTHGKWVGSVPIKIGKFEVSLMSTYTINALNMPIPKEGFSPNINISEEIEDMYHDLLQKAINCSRRHYSIKKIHNGFSNLYSEIS